MFILLACVLANIPCGISPLLSRLRNDGEIKTAALPRGRGAGIDPTVVSVRRDAAHLGWHLCAGRSRRTSGNFLLAASKHSCAPAFALSPANDLPLSSASSTFVKRLRALTTAPVERVVVTSGFLCRCKATICSSAVDRHARRAPTPL